MALLRRLLRADMLAEAAAQPVLPTWEGLHNAALCLEMLQRYGEARDLYRRAQDAAGTEDEEARSQIGVANTFRHQGNFSASLQILESNGSHWPQKSFLLSAHYLRINDIERSVASLYRAYSDAMAKGADDTLDFCTAYLADPESPPFVRRTGAASLLDQLYADTYSAPHVRMLHQLECSHMPPGPPVSVPIRGVCFVSEHFRAGSVASNFEPVLRGLLARGLRPHLWSLTGKEDETTRRLEELDGVTVWRCRPPQLDVAVCLDGHTGTGAAMRHLTCRLARLQIDYLGYPHSTGNGAIDVKIGDPVADEEGAEELYTERLHRLSPCMWAWSPGVGSRVVQPVPMGPRRLLVCQNFKKVRPTFLAACASILEAHPEVTIHFKCTLREDAAEVFQTWISPRLGPRAILAPTAAADKVLQDLGSYHLALDTWPYNGTVTTMECLYVGLPVVTLAGHHHRGRVGTSLLSAAGLSEFVAVDERAYRLKVARLLASTHEELQETRRRVAAGFRASPVMNPDGMLDGLLGLFKSASAVC